MATEYKAKLESQQKWIDNAPLRLSQRQEKTHKSPEQRQPFQQINLSLASSDPTLA